MFMHFEKHEKRFRGLYETVLGPEKFSGLLRTARLWFEISGFLKEFASLNTKVRIFVRFMTMWKKKILARAIRIEKENWEQPNTHFSEIIQRKFGKKMPYILCNAVFLELRLLQNYL